MKKLLVVFALVFAAGAINAQDGPKGKPMKGPKLTPEERAQKAVDHLDKLVTLTSEQKPKIHDLALTRAKKVDAIKDKYKPKQNPDQRELAKKEIKAVHKEYRDAVKPLLTVEQKEKLKAKAKERKEKKEAVKKEAQEEDEIILSED